MQEQQEFKALLEGLEQLTAHKIPENDFQQQIDRWNTYMVKLDEINEACKALVWKSPAGSQRGVADVPMAVLNRNVFRTQSTKTIAFETKPEVIVHTDAYLMQNMRNYQEQFCEPRIKLPSLAIFVSIKWLERESLKMIMEQLSKIRLDNIAIN